MRNRNLAWIVVGVSLAGVLLMVAAGLVIIHFSRESSSQNGSASVNADRSGAASPPATPEAERLKAFELGDTATTGGQLAIRAKSVGLAASHRWIYVDGILYGLDDSAPADSPEPYTIPLASGEHTVEVCLPYFKYNQVEEFPFSFIARKVQVEAGKTSEIEFNVDYPDWRIGEGGGGPKPVALPYEPWEEYYAGATRGAQRAMEEFRQDPVVKVLNDVYSLLQQSQQTEAALFLQLPDQFFGGRQYDARQIGTIVDWLHYKYLEQTVIQMDAAADYLDVCDRLGKTIISSGLRQEFALIHAQLKTFMAMEFNPLKSIAGKMEQLKEQ